MIDYSELFKLCFPVIERREGGYVNDPADLGGETYCGISRKAHKDWPGWIIIDGSKPLKTNQVLDGPILRALVEDFYFDYWENCKAGEFLNNRLSLHHFDFAVNSGQKNAAKLLQSVAGVTVDCIIGPKTIEAVNLNSDVPDLYVEGRRAYYERIAKNGQNSKFLNGWLKRVDIVDAEAHKLFG
jgi:lysozyme family protein